MERALRCGRIARHRGGVFRMLRFDVGPVGAGWLGWGILLGAAFALLVAREVRLAWATRWWVAALLGVALAYAGSVGMARVGRRCHLGPARPGRVLPRRCGRPRRRGLRGGRRPEPFRLAPEPERAAAGLCLLAGLAALARVVCRGRSALPSVGFEQILGWTSSQRATKGYEVLWLGDPASIPAPSWQVLRGVAFAVSTDGLPDGRRLWPSANPGVGAGVETALMRAESGSRSVSARTLPLPASATW